MTTVYIAAPWTYRNVAQSVADKLEASGVAAITWRWWEQDETEDATKLELLACRDLQGIREAAIVLVLNLEPSEGKAFEQGYAMALGKPILILGEDNLNIFQHLLTHVSSVESVIEILNVLYGMECQLGATGSSL